MTRHTILRGALVLVALLSPAAAHALLFRAYVASDGSDVNPCTLPAPCRLLPAALDAVADGGEIWMLDSANYNAAPVNVAKSVTILAIPGALGSVVATGGNAINISTAGVKVVLRNLVIVPLPGGGGQHGIEMTAGDRLTVDDCLIAGLPQYGIHVNTPAIVRVVQSTVRDNAVHGLAAKSGSRTTIARSMFSGNGHTNILALGESTSTTTADISGSTSDGGFFGIYGLSTAATAAVSVSVRDSRVVRSTTFGILSNSTAGASVALSASNTLVSNNASGIGAYNAGGKVWMSGNTVSDNGLGLDSAGGGTFESAGDNAVRNNTTNSSGPITPVARK
jgi:hypothetical protein